MREAYAYAPAAISSFFQVHLLGKGEDELLRSGARGGGFVINHGVYARVRVLEEDSGVKTFLNGRPHDSTVAKIAVSKVLEKAGAAVGILVEQYVEPPIGSGFGTSGASAVAVALAASRALGINLTYNQVGRIAHLTDIEAGTGLGTVIGVMTGGAGLVLEPGAPGIGKMDRIPVDPDVYIVAGSFSPIRKEDIIFSEEKWARINIAADRVLDTILSDPSLETMFRACKWFAEEVGLGSSRVLKLIKAAEEAGAIGATQNMIGEAVHAAVYEDRLERVVKVFRKMLGEGGYIVSHVNYGGPRLVDEARFREVAAKHT